MAITAIDWPTASTAIYTPDIETDYNAQNENLERVVRGLANVSLTNWDATTTAPQVLAGSTIEKSGVLYDNTTDVAISTGSAAVGDNYLAFDGTGFFWVNGLPSWEEDLNGWYRTGNRFTGHVCYWDGGTSFTHKRYMIGNNASSLGVYLYPSASVSAPSITLNTTATNVTVTSFPHTFPAGYVQPLTNTSGSTDVVTLEYYNGTSWIVFDGYTSPSVTDGPLGFGAFISNGSNYRVDETGGVTNVKYAYWPVI